MKKHLIVILSLLFISTSIFATEGVSVFLNAPDNKVKVGFATSVENAKNAVPATSDFNLGKIPLTDDLKFQETTYSDKVFIFYRAIVDSTNKYTLSLELKHPFKYWNGTAYDAEVGNNYINYSVNVKNPTSETKWDGSNSSGITSGVSILSNVASTSSGTLETKLRGDSAKNFVVSGIAQVEISVAETDISNKKYGDYKTEMTLKLTTTT